MTVSIDPVLLGHNPFFGIDHLSQAGGNDKAARFEDVERIAEVMLHCHALGVRGMMLSTHPRAAALAALLPRYPELSRDWRLYPLVPYVQKYVREANQKGMVNLVMDTLKQSSAAQKLTWLLQGGRGLVTRDIQQALGMLIDIELLPFKGRQLGAVFLHDALVDLALGLGVDDALDIFRDHIRKRYGVPAGLVTKNLSWLRARLEPRGWDEQLVMASFNALGFQVNPSLSDCAAAVQQPGMTFVAMSTLAAGALAPDAAYKFLGEYPAIRSVVVGISDAKHAAATLDAIRRHMPFLSPAV